MSGTSFFHQLKNRVAQAVGKVGPIRRTASEVIINSFASSAPVRPRPISMAAEYPQWRGLTDRTFSGRHLPRDTQQRQRPTINELVELFQGDEDRRATDASLLFPFFAQWFTDSFLRTKAEGEVTEVNGVKTFTMYPVPPIPEDGSPPPEWGQDEEGKWFRYRTYKYNESNHEIDLCQIYGMNEEQTLALRSRVDGLLKADGPPGSEVPKKLFIRNDHGDLVRDPQFDVLYGDLNFHRVYEQGLPEDIKERHKTNAYAVGLEHGNSTIGNVLMNILFLREHNRVARALKAENPNWDDERLFQTARNVCIVELLKIVIQDYIVQIAPLDFPIEYEIGSGENEDWYRTNWIPVEFALLYRWHSFIPQTVTFNGEERNSRALRFNIEWLNQVGVDEVCRQASRQKAGRLGVGNTPEFLKEVKRSSLTMSRVCGLAPFNEYRELFGLDRINSFEELTDDAHVAGELERMYGSIDDLEWIVGVFAEGYEPEDMMGDLMLQMVGNDAFTQACTNPLLAKEVFEHEDTFGKVGRTIVKETNTLADLIVRNTGINDTDDVGFNVYNIKNP